MLSRPDGKETILTLTPNGYDTLEGWDFEFDVEEEAIDRKGS
jgi:hypothetical protein